MLHLYPKNMLVIPNSNQYIAKFVVNPFTYIYRSNSQKYFVIERVFQKVCGIVPRIWYKHYCQQILRYLLYSPSVPHYRN